MNLFEASIVLWIQENLRCGPITPLMQLITSLGNGGAFWIVLTAILLIFKKTRRAGLCCALGLILNLIAVNITLKPLIARTRPYDVLSSIAPLAHPHDFSFPSGHAAASFACAWPFFRSMENKKAGYAALALAALIALSRLYVGVHYPTDIICGALTGALMGEAGLRIVNHTVHRLR